MTSHAREVVNPSQVAHSQRGRSVAAPARGTSPREKSAAVPQKRLASQEQAKVGNTHMSAVEHALPQASRSTRAPADTWSHVLGTTSGTCGYIQIRRQLEMAQALANATAFTVGHNIVLGPGAPADIDSREGRALLGHELAHVAQQRLSSPAGRPQFLGNGDRGPDEREAERA